MAKQKQNSKSVETKEKILTTAFSLFTKNGYENVSINEICESLGLTKGAFYYHFNSKSDILIYRYQEEAVRIEHFYDSISSEVPLIKLRKFYDQLIDFFQPDKLEELKLFFKVQIDSHYENFLGSSKVQRQLLAKIIKECQDSSDIRSDVPADLLADILSRYRFGLHIEWCIADGKFDLVHATQRDFEAILKLFARTSDELNS